MDVKSPHTKKKKEDGPNDKPNAHSSVDVSDDSITESVTQAISFSEQTSTEDIQISLTNNSVDVFPNKATEKNQPRLSGPFLLPSMEVHTVHEANQSFRSNSRSQESIKTMTIYSEPQSDDTCAAILMACLFCHPLDCLLATMRGCNECVWSLCSSLCGCEPSALQPLLDITHHCDLCGCLGICCCKCECSICDICLQATECLDLAMEISQMLYH